jgi:predicted negative regulator of RcsB-dependent stress response
MEHKIILLCLTGEVEKAQQFLDSKKQEIMSKKIDLFHYLQGEIYFHGNKRPEALKEFNAALQKNP